MKHVKKFEGIDFNNIVALGRKFFTGHEGAEEKELAKQLILSDIETKVDKLVELGWIESDKIDMKKSSLKNKAQSNNWKGSIVIRKNPKGELFVIYDPGLSGIQEVGKFAASIR